MTGGLGTIDTTVGTADVLHRLLLAVECVDAVLRRRSGAGVRIGRELPALLLPPGSDPDWPCLELPAAGPGRGVLCFDHRSPVHTDLVLRIVDPARRFVARRLQLPPWQLAEILAAEQNLPVVPAGSRLLRPWLAPGSGYRTPRGVTSIRGRVARAGRPVRWARLVAIGPGNQPVGWAHADDRGEFVLVVDSTGTLPPPAPGSLPIDLQVVAPDPAPPPPDPDTDRYADLVVETLTRSANPPTPQDLDSDVLRGRAVPPGYLPNTAAVPQLNVPVGAELTLPADIPFAA
ncbi:hypothetical protein [Jatrophihabitans sp.]|uniref:hypothetical protein n=1 Tax=Jatrophihabitans sp. TaxID=1932789 RepID=UPI002C1E374B|nr:hypothetical protein [Jatrophihabitans sp.]